MNASSAPAVHDPVAKRLRLNGDEVHLWWGRADAVETLDGVLASLSDEERQRGESFHRERDARAFILRRAFLREVLAHYLERRPSELLFESGAHGKPFLRGAQLDLRFSLSRSREHVLLGVAVGREVGVDVEARGALPGNPQELLRLGRSLLTSCEHVVLTRLSRTQRPAALLRAWTRKEALLKALGIGLSREPDTLAVGLEQRTALVPRPCADPAFPNGANLADLEAPDGFAACVALEGSSASLQLRSSWLKPSP